MGIFCGLLAALGWGLADYFVTLLTRRVGTPRGLLYAQAFSLLAWILLLLVPAHLVWGKDVALWNGFAQSESNVPIWAWAVGAGICHVLGLVLSYRAFEIGTLALVSPLASSFAVVTAVLSVSTGRDELPPHILVGAGALFCGIILATRAPSHDTESNHGLRGVPEALGCAVGFGVMFWMMQPLSQHLGPVLPLIVLKIMATSYALVGLLGAKHAMKPLSPEDGTPVPAKIVSLLTLGIVGTDVMAWLAFNYGERLEFTTVVTALASLFSIVTILMAWLILKDRLAKIQWLGIAIILAGVLMVSLPKELFIRP